MAMIVILLIAFLALMFGAELGPKADPTTTTYVPRPDWYFFFLFEVLRVMKNVPKFTPMATIGVPTICMILLFLLPFYDRSPERRIERRPVALAAGDRHDRRDRLPDLHRRQHRLAELRRHEAAGGPDRRPRSRPSTPASSSSAQSGCLACHVIGDNGNNGPGPPLTHIGSKLPPRRDRLDAAQPDRADAVVQGPGPASPAEVQQPRRLPVRAAVGLRARGSRDRERTLRAGRRARHPRGGPGPGDVRPDRRAVRPDELGDDRGAAPPVAPARRRPGGAAARAAARSTSPPGPAIWRSSSPSGSAPAARSWRPTSPSGCSSSRAPRRAPGRSGRGRGSWCAAGQRARAPVRRRRVRRGDGRLRRAQLLRPRAGSARDGPRRRGPAAAWSCSRSPLRSTRRCRLFFELWFDRAVPALGRLAGDAQAYSYLPSSVRRFPGPARAGRGDGRAAASSEIHYVLTAGGIIALHVGVSSDDDRGGSGGRRRRRRRRRHG